LVAAALECEAAERLRDNGRVVVGVVEALRALLRRRWRLGKRRI